MIVCLSGGVGGAKLVRGLSAVLDPEALVVAINTGDDFTHLGLEIWPDFDTTLYTLAGLANAQQGWGRENETWRVMEELRARDGEAWFSLGDKDIALHLLRAQLRHEGCTATEIAAVLRQRFGVAAQITPATDQAVRTIVHTPEGALGFQQYFVGRRAEPEVRGLTFAGAEAARVAPTVLEALRDPALEAIILAPSNPFLSIEPILAVAEMRSALGASHAPIVAVTPIIGGAAVKGPTAKIMRELGMEISAAAVCRHYGDLIDGFVLDEVDAAEQLSIEAQGVTCARAQTLMLSEKDKIELAANVLAFARTCLKRPPS
ncbi:MAG: 2-phospho-L-lactate transferase [Hyphomonadaceae bacterium]|nr:2-phospho-L-lactate transferase [Hyphomonadaceae bacterium]